ncbi:cytochrome c oxidase subunit 3 family protein [Noviherbaspirillum sp.]|uniref:cytochrome c oxidase subunit 3 family protein n=1 Tax=Noviherbaspirillum sp. TaxID=1926288 RepID=UPI002D6BB7B2|nr:cytochrome c oxidase subunit 3 family protein [Noviherbaspirillum sp.]HZW20369.1 cytochrome c oxidase subunit 3 family protein [Noviherbaspirillum sp.]
MMTEAACAPPGSASTAGRIPGNKGIWVGITCEFVEFALMFIVYFLARYHYPEAFRKGPEQIWTTAGAINTVLMVTSSCFIACSVGAMKKANLGHAKRWMVAAIVTALGYPVVKMLEIDWNLAHGIDGKTGIFYTVYYYLTFNHMVHACWGILGMGWVLARMSMNAYTAQEHDGLEALASYWHATDIIWLAIFPLFYVLA